MAPRLALRACCRIRVTAARKVRCVALDQCPPTAKGLQRQRAGLAMWCSTHPRKRPCRATSRQRILPLIESTNATLSPIPTPVPTTNFRSGCPGSMFFGSRNFKLGFVFPTLSLVCSIVWMVGEHPDVYSAGFYSAAATLAASKPHRQNKYADTHDVQLRPR